MKFNIRINSCNDSMGELTIEDGTTKLVIDYDKDDLAHEFVNAYRDLFKNSDDWCKHLAHYLDDSDLNIIIDGIKTPPAEE